MNLRPTSLAARRSVRTWWRAGIATLGLLACAGAQAQVLRIGILQDPDVLDPAMSRSFVGRIVMTTMCDKLFDVDPDMKLVPQLALSSVWSADSLSVTLTLRPGVKFQDGEPFDAEAVKFNIERGKSLPGSGVRGDLSAVQSVDVIDAGTVRLNLSKRYAPLLNTLSDRAGMMVSPKAARAGAEAFARHPVCAGPFAFSQRVAQDRIVLTRFAGYWNSDAIHLAGVTFLPIPDSSVRLANLRSGQLDLIERVSPIDVPGIQSEGRLATAVVTSLGYHGLTINIAKGDGAKSSALARDPRIREAFELSLDRSIIVKVAMEGAADPGNQWVSPASPYYDHDIPVPRRDLPRARALLAAAGDPHPTITILESTATEAQRVVQVFQAMAGEAGFNVLIKPTDFGTILRLVNKGKFEAYFVDWSGRTDPDGNVTGLLGCHQTFNYSGYCNPEFDADLDAARAVSDPALRIKSYAQAADIAARDRPIIYLYHRRWIWAYTKSLTGFRPSPDGLMRMQGLRLH